jgi:hypothetical protein
MTTITSDNFFSTNCDAVDYSMAHILSYPVAGLNDQCSQFHYYLWLFRKIFFLKESPEKVVTWVYTLRHAKPQRQNTSKAEWDMLRVLWNDESITILPMDKCNATVALLSEDYRNKMEAILSDPIYRKLTTGQLPGWKDKRLPL